MLVGIDGRKVPGAAGLGPSELLRVVKDRGLDGVLFRTVFDIAPDLAPGALEEVRAEADALGLYLESGLGNLNPYAMAEHPHLRRAGDGDTVRGLVRAIEAAASIGCRELWAVTGGFKRHPGRFAYDRFRTDVAWTDQLDAIARLAARLAPVCRDLGVHLNLETHEEITSFELVRLIELVGEDVLGLTYDLINPIQRGENPLDTARRVAPYVRQTHVRDCLLALDRAGLHYLPTAVGEGSLDVGALLAEVVAAGSRPRLTLEAMTSAREAGASPGAPHPYWSPITIELFDDDWHAAHPDLTAAELARTARLGLDPERASLLRAADGRLDDAEAERMVRSSAGYLRSLSTAALP
ncbi:MAG: TIM barrel protein [Nocardioides sp.]|uniref:sugar phosphate isomerase/epimerase family protein n=1 Tax=Nocardioides sp. TaxID=35761 RepID=UPI0039E69442